MSRILFVTLLGLILLGQTATFAQIPEPEEKTFDLKHQAGLKVEEETEEEEDVFVLLPEKKIEVSFTLGFLALNKVLFDQKKIIYKYTQEHTYFGDVKLNGQSAFNPMLRLNYNLAPWIAVEPVFGLSVSEYVASIENPERLSNSTSETGDAGLPEAVEEIGEFDAENRPCISVHMGANALIYPHNYGNFGRGHWHPYLIGGLHRTWLSLNSDYIDDASAMWVMNGGGGIRFVADDMISIRFELIYNHMVLDFDPAKSFAELDEGTTLIPVYEYQGRLEKIDDFENITLNSLSWAIGFTANF